MYDPLAGYTLQRAGLITRGDDVVGETAKGAEADVLGRTKGEHVLLVGWRLHNDASVAIRQRIAAALGIDSADGPTSRIREDTMNSLTH